MALATNSEHRLSHEDLFFKLDDALSAASDLRDGEFIMITDVFDDTVVYKWIRMEAEDQLFEISFTVDENDKITLGDDVREVMRRIEIVPVTDTDDGDGQTGATGTTGATANAGAKSKTGSKKDRNNGGHNMTREEKVAALISNCESWTEDHKEFLIGLEDAQLEVIQAQADSYAELKANAEKPAGDDDGEGAKGKTKVASNINGDIPSKDDPAPAAPVTMQEYIEAAPEGIGDALTEMVAVHQDRHERFVKLLAENQKVYSEDDLKAMTVGELSKLATLAKVNEPAGPQANYAGQAGAPRSAGAQESGPPPPPSMFAKKDADAAAA